jgi:hypothetical protein
MNPIATHTYARALMIPFIAAALLFWLFALSMDPVVGDLTRTGRWRENDFGTNAPQPVIRVLENGRAVAAPDMAVLGDSFSRFNLWQSALAPMLNQKILSFDYGDAGCIGNWIRWAIATPSVKTVVIQVVERNFVHEFHALPNCKASTPKPFESTAGATAPARPSWPPTLDAKYLFLTAFNTLRMQLSPGATLRHGDVINSPLTPGCARFSNRRADRLLHFALDERKRAWRAQDLERAIKNVRQLQDEITRAGKRFVFVLAPDKSTAYRACLPQDAAAEVPNVARQLIAAGIHAPDLLARLQDNINRVNDLYHPNNTHWSEAGYVFAAGVIAGFIRR